MIVHVVSIKALWVKKIKIKHECIFSHYMITWLYECWSIVRWPRSIPSYPSIYSHPRYLFDPTIFRIPAKVAPPTLMYFIPPNLHTHKSFGGAKENLKSIHFVFITLHSMSYFTYGGVHVPSYESNINDPTTVSRGGEGSGITRFLGRLWPWLTKLLSGVIHEVH